jgi:hypothetical protein
LVPNYYIKLQDRFFNFDEPPRTHDKLRPGLFVDIQMHIDQAGNHLALAIAYGRHIDADILLADAESSLRKKSDATLAPVNHVLAWQAGDVGKEPPIHLGLAHETEKIVR